MRALAEFTGGFRRVLWSGLALAPLLCGGRGLGSDLAVAPTIVSIKVTPGSVQQNKNVSVSIVFRYSDPDRDLYGGLLRVQIARESGARTTLSFPLTKTKFKSASGQDKVTFPFTNDSSNTVTFSARLWDAHKKGSAPKTAQLWVLGSKVGQKALNFTLLDKDGKPVSLYAYEGKVVLLDFSAMWCGPCQAEAAEAESLYQKYKDRGFIILAVLIEDYNGNPPDSHDLAQWAQTYGLTFPVLGDPNSVAWRLYDEEHGIPLNVLVGRNQVITHKQLGYPDDRMEPEIVEALNQR